ncbi:hypothetical protein EAG_11047, partial [Camponotus floridanus]
IIVCVFQFSQLIISEEYYELIISILFVLGHFWYMFFCNYMGQEVIDHSGNIFYRTYNTKWYVAPLKAQKLLLLVMQRSMRHSSIVIGGLFVLSFEGFATVRISTFIVIFMTKTHLLISWIIISFLAYEHVSFILHGDLFHLLIIILFVK